MFLGFGFAAWFYTVFSTVLRLFNSRFWIGFPLRNIPSARLASCASRALCTLPDPLSFRNHNGSPVGEEMDLSIGSYWIIPLPSWIESVIGLVIRSGFLLIALWEIVKWGEDLRVASSLLFFGPDSSRAQVEKIVSKSMTKVPFPLPSPALIITALMFSVLT